MKKKNSQQGLLALTAIVAVVVVTGCTAQRQRALEFSPDNTVCQTMLQQIEYPDLENDCDSDGTELLAPQPKTISSFQESTPWEITLEEAVELALANSKIMQKLGGVVVNAPQGTSTLYDQALTETQGNSVEAALSAFDAQVSTGLSMGRNERSFNNVFFGGGAASSISQVGNYNVLLSKQTASGAMFMLNNQIDYNRSNIPTNLFASTFDITSTAQVRQPLMRGRGTTVNRIAGPNATQGQYNGVLIARIRSDISLADFEAAVRDLVRDVENNYWELYFAYRDLDTKISARESSRETWENRRLRYENGIGRPDDEAQARQQYFSFQAQAQNALTGVLNGQSGVLGSERNLRRLLGMPTNDGKVIRPISEPAVAPVSFDWDQSQINALGRRVEIRRQKWTVRQRELELVAAKALNQWQFDLVGQYANRGFGDNLLGSRSRANGSAFDSLIGGDLDDWSVGLELGGAIGNRRGHLATRNAEVNLVRERAVLKEQQRQILHDLNAAYTEVDRAMENLKTSFNSRVAVFEELEPKRKRVNVGQDQVFFLLDAEQRAATAESAVHRAVADYNRALLNYSYVSGDLLSRYNIRLSEGQWSGAAQQNASRKAGRFDKRGPNNYDLDTNRLSAGAYDQTGPGLSGQTGFGQPVYEMPVSTEIQGYYPADGSALDVNGGDGRINFGSEVQPAGSGLEALEIPSPSLIPETVIPETSSNGFRFQRSPISAKNYLENQIKQR